jgi:hypothetical protein
MARGAALALCVCFSLAAFALTGRAENPFADEPAKDPPAAVGKPAAAPAATSPDRDREAAIREALDRPTKMEFTETPLQDAIDFLKDYHGIEIQLDNDALEDEGIGSDSPVTRHLSGVSLASALRVLLADIDATYVVRDGLLMVTSNKAAARMTDLRVYAIDQLVGDGVEPSEVADVLQALLAADSAPALPSASKAPAPPQPSPAATLVPFRNLLVIRATLGEHDAIEKLLREFKAKLKAGE